MSDGLEGVVAAETVLSEVDGEAGRLVIRGYPIGALSGHITTEEATHLLLDGFFPDLPDAKGLAAALGRARVEVFAEVAALDDRLLGPWHDRRRARADGAAAPTATTWPSRFA